MSRLAEHLQRAWESGAPFRPGGEIDWEAFATKVQMLIEADRPDEDSDDEPMTVDEALRLGWPY